MCLSKQTSTFCKGIYKNIALSEAKLTIFDILKKKKKELQLVASGKQDSGWEM